MWYWTETNSAGVAFAIWILEHDGLSIPPFDAHPEGDGQLRALGLNASSWRSWIETIVGAEAKLADFMSRHDIRTLTVERRQALIGLDNDREPLACWRGDPRIRSALEALWAIYWPLSESRAQTEATRKRRSWISAGQERRLWRQLKPLHDRLPILRVYPVEYAVPVALPIPPETCVVGIAAADADGRAYVDSVTAAARQLSTTHGEGAATS
jgi:hypothetical protein